MSLRFVQLDEDTFVAAHHVEVVRNAYVSSQSSRIQVWGQRGVLWVSPVLDSDEADAEFKRVTNSIRACEMPT